jgi:antirestriction protein
MKKIIEEFLEANNHLLDNKDTIKVLLAEYLDYEGNADNFISSYRGIFASEEDFVREIVLENESFPDYLAIDWNETVDNYMQDCYMIEIGDDKHFFDMY